MAELVRLFIVTLAISAFSGGLLTTLHHSLSERIAYQELKFVRGPAILQVMEGSSNDPLVDRFKLMDGEKERSFYIGVFDGKPNVVALETFGKGYDGDIGVIVGVNVEKDEIVGISITTHTETPGVGARVKTDPVFATQFKGLPAKDPVKTRTEGGPVDAISGASFSSKGVVSAINDAQDIYKRLKTEILQKMKSSKT
jgi:electron transport complex protein RnfG